VRILQLFHATYPFFWRLVRLSYPRPGLAPHSKACSAITRSTDLVQQPCSLIHDHRHVMVVKAPVERTIHYTTENMSKTLPGRTNPKRSGSPPSPPILLQGLTRNNYTACIPHGYPSRATSPLEPTPYWHPEPSPRSKTKISRD